MGRLGRIVRVVGKVVLIAGAVLAVAVGALFLVGRSHWGQQKLLAVALPLARKALVGELRIKDVTTDLTHQLVLRGVELTDGEGVVAVRAERIGLRYNLLALLVRKVAITAAHLSGVSVHARLLRDGRLNLAVLLKPGDPAAPAAALPVTIAVSDLQVDAQGRADALLPPPFGPAQVQLHAEGEVTLPRGAPFTLTARISALQLTASEPLRAELFAHGEVSLGPTGVQLQALQLQLSTTGEQVNRLVPAAQLHGPLALHAEVSGPPTALALRAELALPQGRAEFRGTVGALTPGLPWRGTLQLVDVGLQAVRADLPPAIVQLELAGSGEGPRGRLDVHALTAVGLAARVVASGWVAGDLRQLEPGAAQADLMLDATAADLRRLQPLGLPAAQGEVQLRAHLQLQAGKAPLELEATGKHLTVAPVEAQLLHLHVHSPDLLTASGQLTLDAEQVLASGLRVERLHGQLNGSLAALKLQLSGHGLGGVDFALSLDGTPTLADGQLRALAVNLNSLSLRRADEDLHLLQPATLTLLNTGPAAPVVVVTDMKAALGEQRLQVDGRYEAGREQVAVQLAAGGIDVQRWAALLGLALPIPKTKLDAHVQLHGPVRAPQGTLQLSGTTQPLRDLPASTVTLQAELAGGRVSGQASAVLDDPAAGPKLALRFVVPLPFAGPLTLDLVASAQAEALTRYLPAPLHELRGALQLSASLHGTLTQPVLRLTLGAPAWQLGALHGVDSLLKATYDGAQLAVALSGRGQDAAGGPLGALTVSARAPLRARLDTPLHELLPQLRTMPLEAEIKLAQVRLPEALKLARPESEPPLQAGLLHVGLQLTGSAQEPAVQFQVRAVGLAAGPVHELAVHLTGGYTSGSLQLALAASLAQRELLRGRASTQLALAQLLAAPATFWRTLPLTAQAELLPFDLNRLLPLLHGTSSALLTVQGTPVAPLLTAKVRATGVQLDTWQLGELSADASFNVNRQLKADLTIQQGSLPGEPPPGTAPGPRPPGGTLTVHGSGPLPWEEASATANPTLSLHADHFRFDYAPDAKNEEAATLGGDLRRLRGTLNADARAELGAIATLQGFVKLTDGELTHKTLGQKLRDLTLELQLQPDGYLKLVQLSAKASQGSVSVQGTAKLDGRALREAQLELTATRFPLAVGSFAGWLDTHATTKARTEKDALQLDVNIHDGTLRLPKLSSSRQLQSLEPLSDVKFIDRAAQAEAARLRAEQEAAEHKRRSQTGPAPVPLVPAKLVVQVQLPGPFAVVGPEVKTDLQGHLKIALTRGSPDGPVVTGEISTLGGWVEVLTRRYQVQHAAVSLSGETPPNPRLDVVISRQLDEATVAITVSGTARRPKLSFSSDPPIYDESQVIAILLSGQGGTNIGSQTLGALSSLIVGQIKEQLGEALPIDVIKLDVAGNDPMGLGSSSLEIGKYLRDDLYFSYMHRFGSATTGLRRLNIDQVRLEYRFLSRFQLTTRYGDAQVGSLDLYWTKRF